MKDEKLKKFMADEAMNQAVYEKVLGSFLSGEEKDVSYLAASMISVNKLRKAWRELEAYKAVNEERQVTKQVGL